MDPRMLSPAGRIVRVLLDGKPKSSTQIISLTGLSKPAVYNNIKDLLLAKYVKECEGTYEATRKGVEAFWSVILNDELAARLVSASKDLGISTYELVELGVRLILDILERGVLPAELQRLLNEYDPSLVSRLKEVVVSV